MGIEAVAEARTRVLAAAFSLCFVLESEVSDPSNHSFLDGLNHSGYKLLCSALGWLRVHY